ncbi:MAG: hypothetical protein PHO66_00165 [Eubacteriales bacterium]|nr:hypothetical protein [Eubacteriales bacterium]
MKISKMKGFLLGLCLLVALAGCAPGVQQQARVDLGSAQGQAQYSGKSPEEIFDSALKNASAVVYAQVVSNKSLRDSTNDAYGGDVDLDDESQPSNGITFKVLETYAGDLGVDEFTVYDAMMTRSGIRFEVGNRYILPVYKISNVYRGGERYSFLGVAAEYDKSDHYIQSKLSNGEDIRFSNTSRNALSAAVRKKAAGTGIIGMDYIHSKDFADIVTGSRCIVQIKVGERFDTHYIDIYDVEVVKTFKGDASKLKEVMFFKDSVKTDEEYIALLMIDDIGWGWFAAMDHCLIPIGDTAKVEEVLKLIEETK